MNALPFRTGCTVLRSVYAEMLKLFGCPHWCLFTFTLVLFCIQGSGRKHLAGTCFALLHFCLWGSAVMFLYSNMSGGLLCIKGRQPLLGGASHIWVRLLWARNSPATQFSNTFGTEESQSLSCIACPREQTVEHRQRNAYITVVCQCPCAS